MIVRFKMDVIGNPTDMIGTEITRGQGKTNEASIGKIVAYDSRTGEFTAELDDIETRNIHSSGSFSMGSQ